MSIDFIMERFSEFENTDAIIWNNQITSYCWLRSEIVRHCSSFRAFGISEGSVVAIEGDFSPTSCSTFIALASLGTILVPLTTSVKAKREEFLTIAEAQYIIKIESNDEIEITKTDVSPSHPMYSEIRKRSHPGLVLFSSGSTGKSKAALHDLCGVLEKFRVRRPAMRTVSFLLYDHIGGVNTMLHTLCNGGCLITTSERTPEAILSLIAIHQVEALPTSPTFINMILISQAFKRFDLSSLKLVTYGTEPMPEATLKRFHEIFPEIRLQQTYGLSEVGILRSKSKSSDSLWVKVGGEGFETRVVDGILQIKARSAMMGYLNAPSPFTEDGWFVTGDLVEIDGDFIKILGRKSELINVGGEKVYPAEVEGVIQLIPNIKDVIVYGEKSPLVGSIVCAELSLFEPEDTRELGIRVKQFVGERLERYKVPVKIKVINQIEANERFKKMRMR